jgi:hypothetical protein
MGYDANGNPEYIVYYHFDNQISSPSDPNSDVVVSIVSNSGTITAITPNPAIFGMNTDSFVYTNNSGNPQLCVELVLTEKEFQPYQSWAIDYNTNACLCAPLPYLPALRLKKQVATTLAIAANQQQTTDCALKVVPNPNNGRPTFYYKYGMDDNNANTNSLSITIIESSTGRVINTKLLPNLAGIIPWWNAAPLNIGHYIVVLAQGGKQLCETNMEIIK